MKVSLVIGYSLIGLAAFSSNGVDLVRNGRAVAVIGVPADAPPSVRLAAKEFQYHIQLATGATLPAVDAGAPTTLPNVVKIGYGVTLKQNGRFRYAVKAGGNTLAISGCDASGGAFDPVGVMGHGTLTVSAGTLMGVYAVLDRQVGIRWIWPGELGVHVVKTRDLAIPDCAYESRPALDFALFRIGRSNPRGWAKNANREAFHAANAQWLMRHRFCSIDMVRGGHAFTGYWKKYGKTHPGYFAMLPDKTRRPLPGNPQGNFISLCVSNPELHRRIADNYAVRRPLIVSVAENDTPGLCCCDRCRAWDPRSEAADFAAHPYWGKGKMPDVGTRFTLMRVLEGGTLNANFASLTDRYAKFYMTLYGMLKKINPQVRVAAQAYANFQAPPRETALDPAIHIAYVGWPAFPYTEERIRASIREYSRWRQSGATLSLRPNTPHVGANMPIQFAEKIGRVFQENLKLGLKGVDFDSLLGEYAVQGPGYYMLTRMTSRPDLNIATIMAEYYAIFGPAATAVKAYFDFWVGVSDSVTERQWSHWSRKIGNISHLNWQNVTPEIFTVERMAEGKRLLERAQAAAGNDAMAVPRVRFLQNGLRNAELTLAALRLPAGSPERKKAEKELRIFRAGHEH